MPDQPPTVRVFVGSSAEGREVARHLQAELGATCEVVRWDQSVFAPSGYALDSLLDVAATVDFAVLGSARRASWFTSSNRDTVQVTTGDGSAVRIGRSIAAHVQRC